MKRFVLLGTIGILMYLQVTCSPAAMTLPQATGTTQPEPPATAMVTQVSLEPVPFLLVRRQYWRQYFLLPALRLRILQARRIRQIA